MSEINMYQKYYGEWKDLIQLEKDIGKRKRYLRERLRELREENDIGSYGSLIGSDRSKRIKKDYLNGMSMQDIADELGCTREWVRVILRVNGVTGSGKKEERNRQIVEMIKSGRTYEDIRSNFRVSHRSISALAKEHGLEVLTDHQKEIRERDKKIIKLYKQGFTQKEVAEKVNTEQTNVSRILRNNGIKRKEVPVDEVLKLKEQGYKAREIANKHNTSIGNVYRIFSLKDKGERNIGQVGCVKRY